MRLDQVNATSKVVGFAYEDPKIEDTFNIGNFSLGAGLASAVTTREIVIPDSQTASASQIRFSNVTNTDVNNKWLVLPGTLEFGNTSPSYRVAVIIERTPGKMNLRFQFYNNTGVTQSIPTITVDFVSYLYATLWQA